MASRANNFSHTKVNYEGLIAYYNYAKNELGYDDKTALGSTVGSISFSIGISVKEFTKEKYQEINLNSIKLPRCNELQMLVPEAQIEMTSGVCTIKIENWTASGDYKYAYNDEKNVLRSRVLLKV